MVSQSTMYYASGVPMAASIGRDQQPYLYNGKEYITAHGLNEYDSQARMYYATIMRTTTMDPHAEKYYHISPYAWCGNNWTNMVDPEGMYIEVTLSGDSTYKVLDGMPDKDDNIYIVNKEGQRTGEILGQLATWYSFFDNNNKIVTGAVINVRDMSGIDFIADVTINPPSIFDYIWGDNTVNGRNGGYYDFKSRNVSKGEILDKTLHHYRGMPLIFDGKNVIGTARDAGNYAAGYIAGINGLPFVSTRIAFDFFQKGVEPPVSRMAQNIGYFTGLYYFHLKQSLYVK